MAASIKCFFFGDADDTGAFDDCPQRPYLAFDRGGQTGPPGSNEFFVSVTDNTGTADDCPAGCPRPDAQPDVRPDVAFQVTGYVEETFEIRFQAKHLTVWTER